MQFGRALGTVASEHRLGWACGRQGPGRDVTDPDMVGPGCCLSSCGRQRRQKEDQTGSKRGLYGGLSPQASGSVARACLGGLVVTSSGRLGWAQPALARLRQIKAL